MYSGDFARPSTVNLFRVLYKLFGTVGWLYVDKVVCHLQTAT